MTLVDTGEMAMTGARVARAAKKYLGDATHFAVTYGDGLTDVNLAEEFHFTSGTSPRHGPGRQPAFTLWRVEARRREGAGVPEKPEFVDKLDQRRIFFLPPRLSAISVGRRWAACWSRSRW